jgi:hypothetical protein
MLPRTLSLLGLAVLGAAAIYAVGDAILSPAPISTSPGFVETVLASRAVVAAVRIAVIFAAAFIVVSIVALTAKRQWPTRIGPVHIREDVSGQETENGQLREDLDLAEGTINHLEELIVDAGTTYREDEE